MADRIGQQLGNYRLTRLLGRGGFAEVYLGEHPLLEMTVAIKVLHTQISQEDVAQFLQEARILAGLRHPHIVRILDFGLDGQIPYLVMDYAPNSTLRARHVRGAQLPVSTVVDYVKQIAEALQYAHDRKVIHRDIKPENMLIGEHGEILLNDFGIALIAQSSHDQNTRDMAGTIAYMAPEQIKAHPHLASDQYSLGIVAYEWLCGTRPFHGLYTEIAVKHSVTPPPSPREHLPMLSPDVEYVILTALKKQPEQRFATVSAFARALEQASENMLPTDRLRPLSTSSQSSPLPLPHQPVASSVNIHSTPSVPMSVGQTLPALPNSPVLAKTTDKPTVSHGVHSAQKMSELQRVTDASRAVNRPIVADQPASVQQPSPPRPQTGSRLWRRSTWLRHGLLVVLVMLLISGGISFFLLVRHDIPRTSSTQTPDGIGTQTPDGIGVTRAPDGEYIGISDGTFAFDTQRPNGTFKTQAAEQLKAHDFGSAESLWEQAVTQETNDAETLIYMEDRRILDAGNPYITVVVGTTLTGDYNHIAVGREATQAAYVAQREYNTGSKLPGGVKVRLLIANSGKVNTYATTVAQQIVRLAQKDKTIVAVMGWTSTPTTLNAIGVLSPAKIPMVSNSGGSQLTGRSSYFFRVDPPSSAQGRVGAVYAEQSLRAKTAAVFFDPKNDFQLGLANGFMSRFTGDGNTIVATEYYTAGKAETLPKALQDALSKHPDMIYFAGDSADSAGLLPYLQPSDPPVLGGCNFYQLAGYSVGGRKGWTHMSLTAYSYPDEWDILGLSARKPPFFADYKADFDPNSQHRDSPYGYNRPDGPTMELSDTISVLLYGCSIALAEKPTITPSDLRRALAQVTGNRAFQGVSSQISFGSDGDPIDRAIVFVCIYQGTFFKMNGIYGKFLVGEAHREQIFTPSVCS
jgi:serine/threonine protein kinase/ABC-type branched-subunit amino acid transport system substrate-binding protein